MPRGILEFFTKLFLLIMYLHDFVSKHVQQYVQCYRNLYKYVRIIQRLGQRRWIPLNFQHALTLHQKRQIVIIGMVAIYISFLLSSNTSILHILSIQKMNNLPAYVPLALSSVCPNTSYALCNHTLRKSTTCRL